MTFKNIPTWALVLALAARAASAVAGQAETGAAKPEPYVTVQGLRVAQDAIAREGQIAIEAYRLKLADATAKLRETPVSAWHQERNASAAVIFVLSGGDHAVGDAILGLPQFNDSIRPLLKASLAFVTGRPRAALDLLAFLNLDDAPPTLRGNLALTRGILFGREEPWKARREFALARLYAPGGIVEQVSLRLEIALSMRDGVSQNAERLLRQLLLRFPRGLHSFEAIDTVADLTSRADEQRQSELSRSIDALLPFLPINLRVALSIGLARRAAQRGRAALAGNWAQRARTLTSEGSAERMQADLYAAAAALLSSPAGEATLALAKIEPGKLSNDDRALLDAAIMVDRHIQQPVDAPPPLDLSARREPEDPSSVATLPPEVADLVKQVKTSLVRTDGILEANP